MYRVVTIPHATIRRGRISAAVSLEVTMLGVLKSGAAYLPLDRSLPPDRLEYMIQEAVDRSGICLPACQNADSRADVRTVVLVRWHGPLL